MLGGAVRSAQAQMPGLGIARSASSLARGRGRLRVLAFAPLALVVGCASLPGLGTGGRDAEARRPVPLRIERPEAPADYDVLVGELAQLEGDFEAAQAAYLRAVEKNPDSAFLHDRLARVAWQLEDMESALREAERAFELDPDSIRIRLFLGRLYRLQGNLDGLDRVLRDADGRPLDADSASALFQVAFDRGDLDEAEQLARDLREREPDQLRGVLAMVSVQERRGEWEGAEATIREGLEAFPNHFLLYMRLVQIKRTQGDRAGEIAVYREVLEGHPDHYGILQRLAQARVEAKDVEGGIETYEQILEAYPDDPHALRRLASLEFSVGRYEAAAGRLEALLERDPDEPDVAFALGQIRFATGDTESAVEAFETIDPSASVYVDARIQIAAIHQANGRSDLALAEIDRARSVRSSRTLDFQAAALRVEAGDFEGGVSLLEGMLDGSPADADVYYQLGVHYGTAQRSDEALEYMERVLELDPDNANALNYIGYTWAERGENLEEAEALIRRALEIAPDDGYITDSLGWVYYKMAESLFAASRRDEGLKLLEQAQTQLLQAAELTGGDSVVSEHLGDVLLLRGDKRGALDYYEEAAGMEVRESEQPQLREKLQRLRRDLGGDLGQTRSDAGGQTP